MQVVLKLPFFTKDGVFQPDPDGGSVPIPDKYRDMLPSSARIIDVKPEAFYKEQVKEKLAGKIAKKAKKA